MSYRRVLLAVLVASSRRTPSLTLVLFMLLSLGCASVSRESAAKLAADISSSPATTGKRWDRYLEGQHILAALQPVKYSAPPQSIRAEVKRIQQQIRQRKRMFDELLKTYTAFAALAAYDAATEVDNAVKDLAGSVSVSSVRFLGVTRPRRSAHRDLSVRTGRLSA